MNQSDLQIHPDVTAKLEALDYDPKVILPDRHHALLLNFEKWTALSRIPHKYVLHNSIPYLSQFEMQESDRWSGSKIKPFAGLFYTGDYTPPVLTRMYAMGGAFMRSYNDCRVLFLSEVMTMLRDDEIPTTMIKNLMIPDLFGPDTSNVMEQREVYLLLNYLRDRMFNSKYTTIGITAAGPFSKFYGDDMLDFLKENYLRVPK